MKLHLMLITSLFAHINIGVAAIQHFSLLPCFEGEATSQDIDLDLSTANRVYCHYDRFGPYRVPMCTSLFNKNGKLMYSGCGGFELSCMDDKNSIMINSCKKTDKGTTCCCNTDFCIGSPIKDEPKEGSGIEEESTESPVMEDGPLEITAQDTESGSITEDQEPETFTLDALTSITITTKATPSIIFLILVAVVLFVDVDLFEDFD